MSDDSSEAIEIDNLLPLYADSSSGKIQINIFYFLTIKVSDKKRKDNISNLGSIIHMSVTRFSVSDTVISNDKCSQLCYILEQYKK